MDKRAKQVRNRVQWRLDRIRDMEQEIRTIKGEIAKLEVEYEELTGESLLTPDRKRVAT